MNPLDVPRAWAPHRELLQRYAVRELRLFGSTARGEAASRIPDAVQAASSDVPWRDMRDMRNEVVDESFGVNRRIRSDTMQTNLPPLIPLLQGVLDRSA